MTWGAKDMNVGIKAVRIVGVGDRLHLPNLWAGERAKRKREADLTYNVNVHYGCCTQYSSLTLGKHFLKKDQEIIQKVFTACDDR